MFPEDCVGNDAGKHNYNALKLEAEICNLNTKFFSSDSATKFLDSFSSRLHLLSSLGDLQRYNNAYTAVSLLSSIWQTKEFSVVYEVNIDSTDGKTIFNPNYKSTIEQITSLAQTYVDTNYPAINYPELTKINVCMFLYSTATNQSRPNDLITTKISSADISYMNRYVTASISRADVYFKFGKIVTFMSSAGKWDFVNLIGPTVNTTTDRTSAVLDITKDVIDFNIVDYTDTLTGYIPGRTDIIVTVSPGVRITSSNPRIAAMTLSNLDEGDSVVLFNYGLIGGHGGEGGAGGDSFDGDSGKGKIGKSGGRGGTAIAAFVPTIIENHGSILGGGGGGGGGNGGLNGSTSTGGGGGGGAGFAPGSGGYRGTNALFKSKGIIVRDGSIASENKGGLGGVGLDSDNFNDAIGGAGGEIGKPGQNSKSAVGGGAGYFLIGLSNVYFAVRGHLLGNES